MKLTKTILLFSSVLLLASCNSGGGDPTSAPTTAPTPTSTAPQIVEFDLPDYGFVLTQKVTRNYVFTYNKTTKKLAIDYYNTYADYLAGKKNTSKSKEVAVKYEKAAMGGRDDNTDMVVTYSSSMEYRFYRQSGFFHGTLTSKEGGQSKAYNFNLEDIQKIDNQKNIAGKTFVTNEYVDVYSGSSKKSYYLKATFTVASEFVIYKGSSKTNWDTTPFYSGTIDEFDGSGVVDSTHNIRVSGYAIIEEKERIFVDKGSTSSDDVTFDGSFYVQEK